MSVAIQIKEYNNQVNEMIELIKQFWLCHNDYIQSDGETKENLNEWSSKGHKLFFIKKELLIIGFIHLGSRGCEIDWVEEVFILPEYQGHGYGSKALLLVEDIVKQYSDSIYLEVAARNLEAVKLYHKLGYDCLNTITICKDFHKEKYDKVRDDEMLGYSFEVRKKKTK